MNRAEEIKAIKRINRVIWFFDTKMRQVMPWLNNQNSIGMIIWLVSISGMIINSVLYFQHIIPAWYVIIINAFLASLLHELEHDIIHSLYFNDNRIMQNIMMMGIWLFRGNLISPWFRKEIHLLHHRASGQAEDIEERLIGNGMKWDIGRLLISLDPFLTVFRLPSIMKNAPQLSWGRFLKTTFPMTIIFNTIWWAWIVQSVYYLISGHSLLPIEISTIINGLMIVNIVPNMIRQMSLSIMSSNCHYYGNIPKGDVLKQTQILEPWYMIPLQIFCFNFGSTHVIHHFVVNQPFYLRQIVAPWAHRILKKYNIPHNDMVSLLHANAYVK